MTNSVDQSGGGQFVFSNGDATGYGFHGDFLNGWDMNVQTGAVQDCLYTDNGGVVNACSHLSPSDDVNFPRDCPEQPSVFEEPVHGLLDALPGCNPITSGPDPAPQVVCPLNSHTPDNSNSTSSSGDTSTSSVSSAASSTIAVTTTSIPESSQSISIITLTVVPTLFTTSSSSFYSTDSVTFDAASQLSVPTASDLSISNTAAGSPGLSAPISSPTTSLSTSPGGEAQSIVTTSFPSEQTIGGIFVTMPLETSSIITSDATASSIDATSDVPTSIESFLSSTIIESVTVTSTAEGSALTSSIPPSTTITLPLPPPLPFYPNTTFTTITSATPSNFSSGGVAVSTLTTLDLSASFACSLYANFSIQGCPPPTPTLPSMASTTADAVTVFVTATPPVAEQSTSTIQTILTLSTTTAVTTPFRIRGREVFLMAR